MPDQLAQVPLTMCTMKATIAAGTTTTLTTTGVTLFCIKGKAYSRAALTNQATPTTDFATGAAFVGVAINKGSIFAVGFDSGGTLRCVQGTVTDLDASGAFIVSPSFGPTPDTFCPIGYIVIKVASNGSTWTFGSSNLSGVTGVTYTFVDVMTMPDRPQIS